MIGTLAKMYAYRKAPLLSFVMGHPRASARVAKARWDFRHAAAPRIAAAGAGLAVAAIALPLGVLLGRRKRRDEGAGDLRR
jgi:hypothetical protein